MVSCFLRLFKIEVKIATCESQSISVLVSLLLFNASPLLKYLLLKYHFSTHCITTTYKRFDSFVDLLLCLLFFPGSILEPG